MLDRTGSAMLDECPKAGYAVLSVKDIGTIVTRTKCKTWRCVPCSKSLLRQFRMRVSAGLSDREPSALITVTYKWEGWRKVDARYVKKDWASFLRRSSELNQRGWVKVPELTKRGMPHHHLVVRGVTNVACYPGGDSWFDEPRFARRFDFCDCFSHQLSRVWYDVTKDTYILHAQEVRSAGKTAAYLGKYMAKQFATREGLIALGVKRRYSFNHRWPRYERMRYVQSKAAGGPGWDEITVTAGNTLSGHRLEPLLNSGPRSLHWMTGTIFPQP